MKHKFPFIGAGYGQYFEWFEMHILFEKVPDAAAGRAILESAPEPIRPERLNFKNDYLILSSDQFVNLYIQEAYGSENDDPDELNEYECSEEASDAFEEDLNRWLLETHEICPIRVVFRPEDEEAGGTDLSEWHDASGELVRPIIESWIKDNTENKQEIEFIAINALYYYFLDDPLGLKILENYINSNLFLGLLQDAKHAELLKTNEVEQGLLKILPNLVFDRTPFGSEIILHAVRTNSDELKGQLHEIIQKQSVENIEWLNRHWYNNYIVKDGFTKEIAESYWILMDGLEISEIELTDLSVYNNMIATCSREVHEEASEERKRKAVAIGEKYASKNPLMYWATFTLQCELNDLDNALVNVEAYFKSNDPNKEYLAGEVKKKDEYEAFRATTAGGGFVNAL